MSIFLYYLCWLLVMQEIPLTLPETIESVDHLGELTKKLNQEMIPATHALSRHFRWRNIALVVENDTMYTKTADSIMNGLSKDTIGYTFTAPQLIPYEYPESFPSVKKILREASLKSRIIVLMMNIRLAKEFLIAAYDLNLTTGNNVFIAFESDIISMSTFHRRPFKWVVAAFGDSWKEYITRSYKLCWMWRLTLLLMTRLPDSMITRINNYTAANVNQAGHSLESWKRFENTVFRKVGGYHRFIDTKGDVQYPLAVYRYGKGNRGAETCALCALNELTGNSTCFHNNTFPSMYPVCNFEFTQSKNGKSGNRNLKLSVNGAERLEMFWPGRGSIYDVHGTPKCGLLGEKCLANRNNAIFIETITASGILLVLLIGLIVIYREYKMFQKPCTQELLNEGKLVLVHCESKNSHIVQHL